MPNTKITGLTAATSPADADLIPIVQDVATTPVTKKATWTTIKAFLKTYFDSIYASALGANDNYVTDAEKTVIGNTSGTNTGDNVEVAAQAVGFTITKGTTPKTLTVALDASVSGTNTGDQDTSVLVPKSLFDAHTVIYATTDNTPVALTVGEQTLLGRATGGNISAIAIDADLTAVSANDDTVPSAKATKTALDLKAPLISPSFTTPALGTPASGTLTNATGLPAAGVVNTAVTLSDAQTVTGLKTLGTTGAIKLGSAVGDKCEIRLNDSALNDESWSGTVIDAVAGATLAVGDVCYLKTADGQWYLNDGILDGTDAGFKLKLGICVLAANDNGATKMLLDGVIASAAFPAFTIGAPVYLDDTAGDLTATIPSTANFCIRVCGFAVSATVLHFSPSPDYIVHV